MALLILALYYAYSYLPALTPRSFPYCDFSMLSGWSFDSSHSEDYGRNCFILEYYASINISQHDVGF